MKTFSDNYLHVVRYVFHRTNVNVTMCSIKRIIYVKPLPYMAESSRTYIDHCVSDTQEYQES